MKSFRNIKKSFLSILMVAILVPTLIFTTTSVKVNAAEVKPIELYCSDTYGGRYSYASTTIAIKVANWDSNKSVTIHYLSGEDNKWHDTKAVYLTTLNDGYEIWEASTGSFGYGVKEFALNTVQNGQTYWDNNNGENYTRESAGLSMVKATRLTTGYNGKIDIGARVKNIAFEKKVTVRYTTDNWATYNDIDLSYSTNQPYDDGTELWNTELSISDNSYSKLIYAIKYEVNGQTYWDNNFGRNYTATNYRRSYY